MNMKQVNVHYDVNGDCYANIVDYAEDSYRGVLIDTIYLDGSSYTDWCAFCGTEQECINYCNEHNLAYSL